MSTIAYANEFEQGYLYGRQICSTPVAGLKENHTENNSYDTSNITREEIIKEIQDSIVWINKFETNSFMVVHPTIWAAYFNISDNRSHMSGILLEGLKSCNPVPVATEGSNDIIYIITIEDNRRYELRANVDRVTSKN